MPLRPECPHDHESSTLQKLLALSLVATMVVIMGWVRSPLIPAKPKVAAFDSVEQTTPDRLLGRVNE